MEGREKEEEEKMPHFPRGEEKKEKEEGTELAPHIFEKNHSILPYQAFQIKRAFVQSHEKVQEGYPFRSISRYNIA